MNDNEIINLYKQAFPQTEHEADAGYILPDGTTIDISSTGYSYCHGKEFVIDDSLAEWKHSQNGLPMSNRQTADFIMKEIGGVEFTIDNCHLRCIRLSGKPLTAEQRQPLSEVIGRILERGSVKVEVLGTGRFAEYDPESNGVQDVMRKIESL